jgi:bleomycin hydrolase
MKFSIIVLNILFFSSVAISQNLKGFEIIKLIPTTEVKDQGYSGTCWSFATISFLETEILRTKKISIDLSEMFIVRNIYPEKVKNYFRTQGYSYFTAGGQPHDVLRVLKNNGLLPESSYKQKMDNIYGYNTALLDTAANHFIKHYRKNEDDIISSDWTLTFDNLLNKHLGVPPTEFLYNNIKYSPLTFSKEFLSLDANNYIQITSFNHHPYNEFFCLESKYNWSLEQYYNVELKRFMSIINNALMNGYTVVFNGDVSEKEFDFQNGKATITEKENNEVSNRQKLFETGSTTVDHVMHIVGIAKGTDGKNYYITKNSWGINNLCEGFIYLSEDYVKLKTISILVNKDALKFN